MITKVVLGLGLASCGAGATHLDTSEIVTAPLPAGWPERLLVGPGEGPALFTGSESNATAIAYLSEGVIVTLTGAPIDGRIPVRIDGPLKLRGFMPLSRLAGRATRRARVNGTPVSVSPGQWIGVRGIEGGDRFRVVVAPHIGGQAATELGDYEGTFPLSGISIEDARDINDEARSERGSIAATRAVEVRDEPNGRVIATLPARSTPWPVLVARREGDVTGVRIGEGPYLSGWVSVPIGPAVTPTRPEACPTSIEPARVLHDDGHPLVGVRAGTRVRIGGRAFGVVMREAKARIVDRHSPTEIDAFIAVDDSAAIRGIIRQEDLAP